MPALATAMPREAHSVEEVADTIGLSPKSVRRAIDRGELRAIRIGRRIVIPHAELVRLLSDASRAVDPRRQVAL